MDSASCGPTSALQNLSKHTQRDTSLQHQQSRHGQLGANPIHSFRSGSMDPRLNDDFQRFNQSNDIGGNSFLNNTLLQRPNVHTSLQGQGQTEWVSDFSNLSINKQPQQQPGPVQVNNNWQQQFIQQRQQSIQPQPQTTATTTSGNIPQIRPNYMTGSLNNLNTIHSSPIYAQQSEHQEVHKLEHQQKQFENEFNSIEKELMAYEKLQQQEDVVQIEVTDSNNSMDKEQFAQTARKVQTAMLSSNSQDEEMQNKINNSNFLKLMNSIGNRDIELEGDKLVDVTSGQDIRQQESQDYGTSSRILDNHCIAHNPMYHDGWTQDFQQQQQQQQQKVEDPAHENKLPDPLAHIKEGELEGINDPLTAARIISGGQVQTRDWMDDDNWLDQTEPKTEVNMWQEVYDDYRHDDDLQ